MEDILLHQIYTVQKVAHNLSNAINERELAFIDWNLLRQKDENSYKNWNNEKVPNYRTKEENIQFNNLSKKICSLNNTIAGLRKTRADEQKKLLKLIEKERYVM